MWWEVIDLVYLASLYVQAVERIKAIFVRAPVNVPNGSIMKLLKFYVSCFGQSLTLKITQLLASE
jgi:hypothetical protein